MVRTLLALDANASEGMSSAIKRRAPSLLRVLLEAGGDPNMRLAFGTPLVFEWIDVITPDALRLMVSHGLDVNTRDRDDPLVVVLTIHRYGITRCPAFSINQYTIHCRLRSCASAANHGSVMPCPLRG